MPPISPTTLLVAGSISMTLSPAALVCTIRTVAASKVRLPASTARARESLVFMATHFKLPRHVGDCFFGAARPVGILARFRGLQGESAAAACRKAAGPCPLHHLPFHRHRLPAAAAAEGPHRLQRRRDP